MVKGKKKKSIARDKTGWDITFADGTKVETGYYPNPRMAVAEALKDNKNKKVKDVSFRK